MGNVGEKSAERSCKREEAPAAPETLVGTQLVLVLKPGAPARLQELSAAAEKAGLVATQVLFPEGSPLHDFGVLTVGATASALQRLAEEQGLHKRLDSAAAASGPLAEALASADSCGMELWRPFARARAAQFAGATEAATLFAPAEVLSLLSDALCVCNPARGTQSALLTLQAAGQLDCVLALPDADALARLCAVWSPMALWRPVPGAQIAAYFGASIAQYFILMRVYARWLLLPTCLGLASFVWNELRERKGADSPIFANSTLAPAFAVLVIVWSTVCLSNWQRAAAVARYNLGQRTLGNLAPTLDSAGHYFKSRGLKVVDGSIEAQAPPKSYDNKPLRHVAMVFAMLALLCVSSLVVGVLLWIGEWAEAHTSNVILQNSPVLLYLFVVGVFQKFYDWLAERLTSLEGHLSHAQHVRSLTIKTAFFQLINYLGWFLYLAFWKRDYHVLRAQLLIFFTVKQAIGNFVEIGVPAVKAAWAQRASDRKLRREATPPSTSELALRHAIEQEWLRPTDALCDDYLEVAVLFSATTWFAPVFPLGIVLAFAHSMTEAWADSYKVCNVTRRMVPQGANEAVLEAWLDVFRVIGCLGIGISLALFRFGEVEMGWDRFYLEVAEKLVLFIWLYLQLSIPNKPEWLTEHLQQVERLLPMQEWLSSAAQKKQA